MARQTSRAPVRNAIGVVLAALPFIVAVACSSSALDPATPSATDSSGTRSPLPERCPPSLPNCLAWDAFSGPSGPIVLSTSGQPWATWGLACSDCRPVFETDGSRARMAPGADKNFIWLATIDTGYATGITVSANIRLSPTPLRANVGLVALFADRMNHLVCKVEVTEGHPDGLLAIGDQQHGTTTSLLAYRDDVGLVGGETYRLELRVPSSPAHSRVTCRASGQGIQPTKVAYQMTAANIAAYGAGTGQGLRIKIFEDEDDGNSSWDDFDVARTATGSKGTRALPA